MFIGLGAIALWALSRQGTTQDSIEYADSGMSKGIHDYKLIDNLSQTASVSSPIPPLSSNLSLFQTTTPTSPNRFLSRTGTLAVYDRYTQQTINSSEANIRSQTAKIQELLTPSSGKVSRANNIKKSNPQQILTLKKYPISTMYK